MSSIQPPSPWQKFRGVSPFFLVDLLCPALAFQLLLHIFPHMTAAAALALTGIFPALSCIRSLLCQRHPDVLGLVVLAAMLLAVIAALSGIEGSLLFPIMTGTVGMAFLVSLLCSRPLIFSIGRQVVTRNNAAWIADFNALWQTPKVRAAFYLTTLVWGLGLTLEFVVQIMLSRTLPSSSFPLISTLLKSGVFVGIMIWTVVYIRCLFQLQEE